MNRAAFLRILRDALAGLPAQELDEILADYAAWFDEAGAAGRSEETVAAALGDPRRLARELRTEAGLRRFENHRSLRNVGTALLALGGLAAVDLVFLLPLLFAVVLTALVVGLVAFILGIVGIGALLSLLKTGDFASVAAMALRGVAGIGLLAAGGACEALLLFALKRAVRMLGGYARLHYRLLKPQRGANQGSSGDVL